MSSPKGLEGNASQHHLWTADECQQHEDAKQQDEQPVTCCGRHPSGLLWMVIEEMLSNPSAVAAVLLAHRTGRH